ncbi:MAG: LOG family protein [Candidatus Promineifilaceae bacterium]
MNSSIGPPVISVFGSHAPKPDSPLYRQARELGYRLTEAGFKVATGGYEGTMAAVSQGAVEAGGHPVGVTSSIVEASRGASLNRWIEEEVRYETLQERLYHLVTRNEGMVALEGGIGTLSELSLAWTLLQVNEIQKRPLVVMGQLWKDFLLTFIRQEYVSKQTARLVKSLDTPAEVVSFLLSDRSNGSHQGDFHV